MSINLREFIENEAAVKEGGFTGAVFLTYSLDLNFYEQIIAPALEHSGCANILILTDPDGYAEATNTGYKTVTGVGLRYVCSPLVRSGGGLQHVKMLFMAGPNHGRLLIGSGNLTLHGYGRNLELYSCFEYSNVDPDPESKLAMNTAWSLINEIKDGGYLAQSALQQIEAISEKATWLGLLLPSTITFQLGQAIKHLRSRLQLIDRFDHPHDWR